MKINRYKKAKKILGFYRNSFGFRAPYQVLLDATFCQIAIINRVEVKVQLERYLDDKVFTFTTPCIINECEELGIAVKGALCILKSNPLKRCNHSIPIKAIECIKSMIGENNESHIMVATQEAKKIKHDRVPVIYLHGNNMQLVKPGQVEFEVDDDDIKRIKLIKEKLNIVDNENSETKKRKKKVQAPNPLSCKKKKIKVSTVPKKPEPIPDGKKRKRVRKRIRNPLYKMLDRISKKIDSKSKQKYDSHQSETCT